MNAVVFPVVYHDKFYRDVLDAGDLAKLAYYNDIVVGAVCCRVDTSAESGERKLYIMTLGECSLPSFWDWWLLFYLLLKLRIQVA